jgi:ABC-type lipoprotein release transport system permease subunit
MKLSGAKNMLYFKLAIRNLLGAGLRTWLNVFVLSISYVVIIWHYGLLDGWNRQAEKNTIEWQIGGGQYWNKNYDPYDPFTLEDSHAKIPQEFSKPDFAKILITQATIYPEGRLKSVLLNGINPDQKILKIPTGDFVSSGEEIPAIIGRSFARNSKLKVGDFVTVRWRDVNGTFDATELKIVQIFSADVPSVDVGQVWVPLRKLQEMMQLQGEATIITVPENYSVETINNFEFKNHDYLLKEIREIIKQKQLGGSIIYLVLLALAMLAIFDTQILSIFRRQKEIGTHIALGMTRKQVIAIFTIEGALHSILAAFVGAIYGIPLLANQAINGFEMPGATEEYGMAIARITYPYYSLGLVVTTILIVVITSTIVSFLPTRKIAKMKPTDAIRGKIQ